MKSKSKKPLVIISFLILVGIISMSFIFYTRETKTDDYLENNIGVSTKILEFGKEDENESVSDDREDEPTTDVTDNVQKEQTIDTSVAKNQTTTNQNSTSNQTTKNSSSASSNVGQSSSKPNDNIQTETKKMTKQEIEDYVRRNIPDFRYDFDSEKECRDEGEAWAVYGWLYNCPSVEVPNSDIKPHMLVISTGKLFCDGSFTKDEKYYYENPKISSITYLREIGYPCENIEGTN